MKCSGTKSKWYGAALLFGLLAVAVSLRGDSFWIDEGITYRVVSQGFGRCVQSLADLSAGSAQCGMPLYILLECLWVQLMGTSEWAMRASNILFILPFLVYAAKSLQKLQLSPWYMALFALNSVCLYYLNEARPYALLLSMGMMFCYYVMLADWRQPATLARMYVVFFLGMTTHMMFLFAYFAYLARCVFLWREGRLDVRLHLRTLLYFALPLLALAAYYLYVFTAAHEVHHQGASPLSGILQILYAFGGFSGLALNRNHLKDRMFSLLQGEHVALILLLVAAYAGMLVFLLGKEGKRALTKEAGLPLYQWLACFLVPLTLFFAGNILLKTRFWERHCIYLLPFMLIILCRLLQGMFACPRAVYRACAVGMVVMQLVSGGRLMLDPYYDKEDYQGVARWFAQLEEDQPYTLLYQGSDLVFDYYGWHNAYAPYGAQRADTQNTKRPINHCSAEEVRGFMQQNPGLYYLVLNETSVYDTQKLYQHFDGDVRFQHFQIVRAETP